MTGLMLAVATRGRRKLLPFLFTARFSQYWIQSLNDETASLAVSESIIFSTLSVRLSD